MTREVSGRASHQPSEPHHCVVVVHGIGDPLQSSMLIELGEPFVEYLANHIAHDGRVAVDTDLTAPATRGADAVLRLRPSAQKGDERVIWLREAWWAQRFSPPPYRTILRWTLRMFLGQIGSILTGIRHALTPERGRQASRDPDDLVYQPAPCNLLSRVYDTLVGTALLLLFIAGFPLVFAAVLLAWVLENAIGLNRLPGVVATAAGLLRRFSLSHLGDAYVYIESRLRRASIRDAVEDTLLPSLAFDHLERCKSLTIIGHSWGAVVALDSLVHLSERTDIQQRPLTLLTVGAGLNRAWRLNRFDPVFSKLRTQVTDHLRRLDKNAQGWPRDVRWINVWSRYDPVPTGDLLCDLRQRLVEENGWTVRERRVANLDDPLSDHGTYWKNAPEVLSRITYEVLLSTSQRQDGGPKNWHTTPEGTGILASIGLIGRRRHAVGVLALVRLVTIAAAALMGVAWLSEHTSIMAQAWVWLGGALAAALLVHFTKEAWAHTPRDAHGRPLAGPWPPVHTAIAGGIALAGIVLAPFVFGWLLRDELRAAASWVLDRSTSADSVSGAGAMLDEIGNAIATISKRAAAITDSLGTMAGITALVCLYKVMRDLVLAWWLEDRVWNAEVTARALREATAPLGEQATSAPGGTSGTIREALG